MACNVKSLRSNSSQTSFTPGFQSVCRSSTNGLKYTLIRSQGCFGPETKIDNIKYFRFLHNQGGRFNTERTTDQVLCIELWLPNGFTPSVLIANRMFLQSSSNQGKWASMLPHYAASAGCLSLPSPVFLQPSLCQRKSWASFRVANMRFKWGMMGK